MSDVPEEAVAHIVSALRQPNVQAQVESAARQPDPVPTLAGMAYGLLEGVNDRLKDRLHPTAVPKMTFEIVELLTDLAGVDKSLTPRVMDGLFGLATDGAKIQAQRIDMRGA